MLNHPLPPAIQEIVNAEIIPLDEAKRLSIGQMHALKDDDIRQQVINRVST